MPDVTSPGGLTTIAGNGAAVLRCPVDGCSWRHDEPALPDKNLMRGIDAAFGAGPGMMEAIEAGRRPRRVENALLEHFRQHEPSEWVATIARLRSQVERAGLDPDAAIVAVCDVCGSQAFPDQLTRSLWIGQHFETTHHVARFAEEPADA